MKIAIYARESSKDTEIAPPIQNQIDIGLKWANDNNHEIVSIYQDNGYSGGNWQRPGWNKSKRDAKRHYYKILWVWSQDRIARDTEQFLHYYRHLNDAKIRLYSETEGYIDMETLGGRVKHTALAQAAEIFRIQTSEKVKKSYKAKKIKYGNNLKWGRPKKKVDRDLIRRWRKKGFGYRKIADHHTRVVGKISHQTVKRVIDEQK